MPPRIQSKVDYQLPVQYPELSKVPKKDNKQQPEKSKYSPYYTHEKVGKEYIYDDRGRLSGIEDDWGARPLTWEELPYRETVMDDMGNTIPNPEAHPGLMGLTPFSPADFALETLFTGAALAEDPLLAMAGSLALTRYGKKAAKFADVQGGHLIGKNLWEEGMRRVKSDPMLGDIPFSKVSKMLPGGYSKFGYMANAPRGGGLALADLLRLRKPRYGVDAPLTSKKPEALKYILRLDPAFNFVSPRLSEIFRSLRSIKSHLISGYDSAKSIVAHEGRHFKQLQELRDLQQWKRYGEDFKDFWFASPAEKPYYFPNKNISSAAITKRKYFNPDRDPITGLLGGDAYTTKEGLKSKLFSAKEVSDADWSGMSHMYNTLIDIPVPKNPRNTSWISFGQKNFNPKTGKPLKKPGKYHHRTPQEGGAGHGRIEVEARLEQMYSSETNTGLNRPIRDLMGAGYTKKEITIMFDKYVHARHRVYGGFNISKFQKDRLKKVFKN